MSTILFFPCSKCGKEDYTIRSLCEDCAPQLHKDHRFISDITTQLCDDFEAKTGVSALADWCAFEKFMAEQLADTKEEQQLAMTLERLLLQRW